MEEQSEETEKEEIVLEKMHEVDGEFSSGSSSSYSSSWASSTLQPLASSSAPICMDEEKEVLSGCSKSFTGLKIFTRR